MEINGLSNNLQMDSINATKNKVSDENFEKRLKKVLDSEDEKELKEVCNEFEGVFLNMLYKQMKASIPESDFEPDSIGKNIFESMLDEKLMERASQTKGIGFSDMLYKHLSQKLKSVYKISDE